MIAADGALLTDLYQLTMLEGYYRQQMNETAVFEWFVRKLPDQRGFLVAAGLEQALDYLENLSFSVAELEWMQQSGRFSAPFVESLAALRFEGDVHALPEGTVFFADQPVLRITAPLPQAQLVESRLINLLQYQILVASKAARCRLAAPQASLVDFGMRRAHGSEAAMFAARCSYLAGFDGTATVAAGARYQIPLYGTMAHSFIQAHALETEAFTHFAHAQPDNVVLLIDTYDTEAAARKVLKLAPQLARSGIRIKAVRIDSGDLGEHARAVRNILDSGGHPEIGIFASGDLDEYALTALVSSAAPIDGYGIGTKLDTSADAPFLNCAYKLQIYAGRPRRKRSEGKVSWPGRKQVFRTRDDNGDMLADTVDLEGEPQQSGALLRLVMKEGRRLASPPALAEIRSLAASELGHLPAPLRRLDPDFHYPVTISPALQTLAEQLDQEQH